MDFYEGYPRLYGKDDVTVRASDGQELSVMAYIMTGEMWRDPAIPSQIYYDGIMDGYRQNGLPIEALEQAWDHVMSVRTPASASTAGRGPGCRAVVQ